MEPHNAETNRIVLFMISGLILIVALVVVRSGGPIAPIRRWVLGLRKFSPNFDMVTEALERLFVGRKIVLFPLAAWLVQFYGFLFGPTALASFLLSKGYLYETILPLFLGLTLLQGLVKGLILFWFIRGLMLVGLDAPSQHKPRTGVMIFAGMILAGYITGLEVGIFSVTDNIALSILNWDISVLSSWMRTVTAFTILPFVMFGLSCLLVLWIPQIAIGRPARFGRFVQRTSRFGVSLFAILLMASLVTSLVLEPINALAWMISDLFLGFGEAVIRGWIIDGILLSLATCFLFWQLAIIVVVSERVRISLTEP